MSEERALTTYNTDSEFESESLSSGQDSEHESSDSDKDYDSQSNSKRRKIEHRAVTEELLTDATGHIHWYRDQQLKKFRIESALGEGAFGRVLRVRHINTGNLAALKVIKNEPNKRKSAMVEVKALTIIGCRDRSNKSLCIKMLSWFSHGGHVCIAFPLLGLSVYDFQKANNYEPFEINELMHISYQLCVAVAFLHSNKIIHTDLKPENMLFVDSSYKTVFCKKRNLELRRLRCSDIRLTDFGNVVSENEYHPPIITTRYYRSPKVILKLDWTETCDIWSIGCILVEMHVGQMLFATETENEHLALMETIIGKIPSEMVNASQTTYFRNGNLDWDWNRAEEDVMERRFPLGNFQQHDDEVFYQLFHVIRQMLIHVPHQRIPLREALTLPFFENLPASRRINE